ncbi:MAG TPA: class I SAM-dependent methyltransferase [Candidatus Nanoarchaeia archaeon]|nr:class I SAM-dependent methyltransferase [Candidatus Nanoarchaeia archaeon]
MNEKFLPAAKYRVFTPLFDIICNILGLGEGYRKEIINVLHLKNKKFKVLDIGCGTGSLIIDIKKKFPKLEVIGVDPDQNILRMATNKVHKNHMQVRLVTAFAQKLPFHSNHFDVVVSSLVFHHVPSQYKQQALNETHRVLKPSGIFLLSDFGRPKNKFPLGSWLAMLFEEGKENYQGLLPQMIRNAGFKEVKILREHRYGIQLIKAGKAK